MYASLTVIVNPVVISKGDSFKELEFPQLKAYLDSGWSIKDVHQVTPSSTTVYTILLTFVLVKN